MFPTAHWIAGVAAPLRITRLRYVHSGDRPNEAPEAATATPVMFPTFAGKTPPPLPVGRSPSSPCRHSKQGVGAEQNAACWNLPPPWRTRCSSRLCVVAVWPLGRITMDIPGTEASSLGVSTISLSLGHPMPPVTGAFLNNVTCAKHSPPAHRGKDKAKAGKEEHHLWMKRDSAGSGQKALNLVRIVSKLPNEKEAIYGALDKWSAFDTEFPLVAIAKALGILRRRNQWLRIIQVTKWLLNKGQGMTMGTYDVLLLAFDMDGRVDEAETLWDTVLQTQTRSVSKRLFSRMISLYNHHHMPDKILEVFADMEELGVKPDEDTVRRVGRAFLNLGQEDNQKRLLQKYGAKFRYLHFNGERVRVRNSKESDN